MYTRTRVSVCEHFLRVQKSLHAFCTHGRGDNAQAQCAHFIQRLLECTIQVLFQSNYSVLCTCTCTLYTQIHAYMYMFCKYGVMSIIASWYSLFHNGFKQCDSRPEFFLGLRSFNVSAYHGKVVALWGHIMCKWHTRYVDICLYVVRMCVINTNYHTSIETKLCAHYHPLILGSVVHCCCDTCM